MWKHLWQSIAWIIDNACLSVSLLCFVVVGVTEDFTVTLNIDFKQALQFPNGGRIQLQLQFRPDLPLGAAPTGTLQDVELVHDA